MKKLFSFETNEGLAECWSALKIVGRVHLTSLSSIGHRSPAKRIYGKNTRQEFSYENDSLFQSSLSDSDHPPTDSLFNI